MEEGTYYVAEIPELEGKTLDPSITYSFSGFDTDSPTLVYGDCIFVGTFEEILGTHVVGGVHPNENTDQTSNDSKESVPHLQAVQQKVVFRLASGDISSLYAAKEHNN